MHNKKTSAEVFEKKKDDNEDSFDFLQSRKKYISHILPKQRRQQTQAYLKNLSDAVVKMKNNETQSELNHLATEENCKTEEFLKKDLNFERFQISHRKNHHKSWVFDPISKFSCFNQKIKGEDLSKVNKELFPSEFHEEIKYIPDYSARYDYTKPSYTDKSESKQVPKLRMNTLTNAVWNKSEVRKLNLESLQKNKFSTYGTGWKSFYGKSSSQGQRKTISKAFLSEFKLTN